MIESITTPEAQHAFYLTLVMVAFAVPANTVFGVICALALVRDELPGQVPAEPLDRPRLRGLAGRRSACRCILIYGRTGWLGGWLADLGIRVIYAPPGMVLACIFVSLPFVVREVVPVLREIGTDQEQAASTLGASPWQTFWKVTLPAIRWGVGYGVVLSTARVLGEFGAISVVSGRLSGQTETLTLRVEDRFQSFDLTGAYAASMVLGRARARPRSWS